MRTRPHFVVHRANANVMSGADPARRAIDASPRHARALGDLDAANRQAFSHLGLINAALRIDLALRLRDEGSPRSRHLVGSLQRKAHPR